MWMFSQVTEGGSGGGGGGLWKEKKHTYNYLFCLYLYLYIWRATFVHALCCLWFVRTDEGGGSGVTLVLAATEPGVPEPENGLRFSRVKPTLPLPQRTTCTCSLKDAWTAARVCAMGF